MNTREQDQLALILSLLAKTLATLKHIDPEAAAQMLAECRSCGVDIHLIMLGASDPGLN